MLFIDKFYCIIGRTSLVFDVVRPLLLHLKQRSIKESKGVFDKTGLVTTKGKPPEII